MNAAEARRIMGDKNPDDPRFIHAQNYFEALQGPEVKILEDTLSLAYELHSRGLVLHATIIERALTKYREAVKK